MDDQITEPPWRSDVAGIIYAPNGSIGRTDIAILHDGAHPELLAAAPDLLAALEESLECLERAFSELKPNDRRLPGVLKARAHTETAIAHARHGKSDTQSIRRHWEINSTFPDGAERKANEKLLDAAPDLLSAAKLAFAAANHASDSDIVVSALCSAIERAA